MCVDVSRNPDHNSFRGRRVLLTLRRWHFISGKVCMKSNDLQLCDLFVCGTVGSIWDLVHSGHKLSQGELYTPAKRLAFKIVPSVSYWEGVRGLYHVRSLLSLRREWDRHSSLVRNRHTISRVPQLSFPASTSLLEFVLRIFWSRSFRVSLPTLAPFALFSKEGGISRCQDGLTDGLFCPGLSLCRNISLHSCPQGA